MTTRRLLLPALLLALTAVRLPADSGVNALLPLKPEVRQVINDSCVMCHGEVINGEKETRDDLDLCLDLDVAAVITDKPGVIRDYLST